VEVFVNVSSKQFYFNRYYMDEMQIYDVAIYETYAILIGYDAHRVVYHSVFHGFQQDNLETHSYFSLPQLITLK
jgi:hypothetical protein